MADRRNAIPELRGTARELARGGESVVDTERGVVFVRGLFPGESAVLTHVQKHRGALFAQARNRENDSPHRVASPCAHHQRCGGCPWIELDAHAQQEAKRAFLMRAVGPDVRVDLVESPMQLGYRRRARLAWDTKKRLGYRAVYSADVVDVDTCVVLDPRLDEAHKQFRAHALTALAGDGEVQLAFGAQERVVLAIRASRAQSSVAYAACESLAKQEGFAGVALSVEGGAWASWGDAREVRVGADGLPLIGTVGGFSQANDAINDAMRMRVRELAGVHDKTFLELFCGHGNLTTALAPDARSGTAVEIVADAAQACRENLRTRGFKNVHVLAQSSADALRGPRADVVVLDPPRAGAADCIDGIAVHQRPERVVYVSCDTATLERDVRAFAARGYRATHAVAFDMFPQTAHVESVVCFSRESAVATERRRG